jgi:hypothetical protein
MKVTTLTVFAAALAATPALAEDEHRELGAHEHGHGTLNIAVEKARISMELEVPGMDIVGFEHAAESKDDKAAVDKASKALGEPLKLFKVPEAAGCKVADTKVKIEAEHEDGDKDHDAKAEEKKGDDHAKEAHGNHDHEEHEGHNAFHVTYALDCTKPAALTSIAFDYFKSFAGAQALTVNVVTDKAQNKYEVSRDQPNLDLGGIM